MAALLRMFSKQIFLNSSFKLHASQLKCLSTISNDPYIKAHGVKCENAKKNCSYGKIESNFLFEQI